VSASEAGFERAMRECLGVVEANLGAQVEGWLARAREASDGGVCWSGLRRG
jgi:hypothetical protein